MKYVLFTFLTISMLTVSCNSSTENTIEMKDDNHNHVTHLMHSYANLSDVKTTHLHLDLEVDFKSKTIFGVARHQMQYSNQTNTAIFDVKNIDIQKITAGKKTETPLKYTIGKYDSIFGAPLTVTVDSTVKFINIYYQTTNKTEALDWLAPEQTEGKKYPYLYSQGQAILTRSWIPLQDSPSNRFTYSADVQVPKEFLALMSAENPVSKNETGLYHFEMNQPIPSYLMAIAVGNIVYQKLGENCGVYTEPELLEACAYEFVDLPKMIQAAAALYGEYRWEQYDVIVLPYSFPFGGMENPRLTFANPTLITGDRSLVSVIAHELAHSWSGNLVTNVSWEDFWLNEGFTVYFEGRIMEKLYGKEISNILSIIGYQELQRTLNKLPKSDTKLKLDLTNRAPDDGLTDIAYVKGAYFLRTLEEKVGRAKMDAFLNEYFDEHAFQTINTEDFVSYLKKHLLQPNNIDFNVDEWIYQPGIPSNCVQFKSPRLEKIKSIAQSISENAEFTKLQDYQLNNLSTQEWMAFIRELPHDINPAYLRKIDKQLNFATSGNSEIMCEWFMLAITSGYKDVYPEMEAFLNKVGRLKFLEPIYATLIESDDQSNIELAHNIFNKSKIHYHPMSKIAIQDMLHQK